MRFTERASFTGGESDAAVVVPAEIKTSRPGGVEVDDQQLSSGGMIEFCVRYGTATKTLLTQPAAHRVEFLRWQKGVYYTVRSALREMGGHVITLTARRV